MQFKVGCPKSSYGKMEAVQYVGAVFLCLGLSTGPEPSSMQVTDSIVHNLNCHFVWRTPPQLCAKRPSQTSGMTNTVLKLQEQYLDREQEMYGGCIMWSISTPQDKNR